MSRYHGEQVLVVPRAAFEEAGYFQGHREGGDHYLNAFMKPGVASFMDREAAENDPSHKQIIAYAIFCHQGRILHYTRGGSGGEARLHDKGSIGIGGHINNAARGLMAVSTLGMSNLVWKKSKGGEKTVVKNQKICLCQNCGNSWEIK